MVVYLLYWPVLTLLSNTQEVAIILKALEGVSTEVRAQSETSSQLRLWDKAVTSLILLLYANLLVDFSGTF